MSQPPKKRSTRSPGTKKGASGPASAPRVFISYAHGRDDKLARELADTLRQKQIRAWLDVDELTPGENWQLAHGRALESSDVIVVLLSKDYLRSPSAAKEWEFALGSKKHAGRVLPVLTPGTREDAVPWIFKHVQHLKSGSDWGETSKQVATALRALGGAA